MSTPDKIKVTLLSLIVGFLAASVVMDKKEKNDMQHRPEWVLRRLINDDPVYSATFWITNHHGVLFEVKAVAIQTNHSK